MDANKTDVGRRLHPLYGETGERGDIMSLFPSMRRTGAIMKKEFIQLRRDRATFAMIVMIPIMQLLLFGYAINSDPKQMPTAILAQDHGSFARRMIVGLANTDYFKIVRETASVEEATDMLQKGEIQFVVTIPENFGRDLARGAKPEVLIETDATDPTASLGAIGALNGMLDRYVTDEMRGPLFHLRGTDAPVRMVVHKLYNPEGFSRYNIVPGLMGIVLTLTCVMMTALALTRERERGTMENLLSMPVKPIEVMIGKILPYVLIGYLQSAIILGTAKFVFGVPFIGSLWFLSVALAFFIISNLALGFTFSAVAKNQMQAMQMSFMVLLPSVLLSGFMFPFWGMPGWAQGLGSALPATYFIRIVRGILLKGTGFVECWPNLWPLFLFTAVATCLAMKFYRKTVD
jgi:ABC-2 type transport system permease protein